ncbi:hypothetical protein Nepgr_000480 [Nepenthes gracilis]|uniref:Uncharacterized protein n=1 Tax=Nepenthes gracilis TaxID=150966 RepID=A0AAD3RWI0_NEPGR|nr:hypothetical protein Nepgr_000480 [Nepenthes gracilis]
MKSPSRSKFLLCFRPMEMDSDGVDCAADRVLSYISVSKKGEDVKIPSPASFSDGKSSSRRSFSGAFKAVLFETSLSKRLRDRKQRKHPHRSCSDLSDQSANRKQSKRPHQSDSDLSSHYESQKLHKRTEITAAENPPALTTSPESENPKFLSQNKRLQQSKSCASERYTNRRTVAANSLSLNYVMCLVLFCLWFTVFWGRLSAVMMTTIWIYGVEFCKNLDKGLRGGVREESCEGMNTRKTKQRSFREH